MSLWGHRPNSHPVTGITTFITKIRWRDSILTPVGTQVTSFLYASPRSTGKTIILSTENRKNVHCLENIFSRWKFPSFVFFLFVCFFFFLPLFLWEDLGGIETRIWSACTVNLSQIWPSVGKVLSLSPLDWTLTCLSLGWVLACLLEKENRKSEAHRNDFIG